MLVNFQQFSDTQLIQIYSQLLKELKTRRIINSNNLVGDLGETLAISHYRATPVLPTLSAALAGTIDFDAVGRNGKRYSIKATSGQVTGSFFGLPSPTEPQQAIPNFDYVIVVKFDADYTLEMIVEVTWAQFLAYRRWLPRQNAYNLPLTQRLLKNARVVYPIA